VDARSLDGRVALVTGAASGMGAAVAALFAADGARVAACDVNPAAGPGTAGGAWALDVSDPDQVVRVVGEVTERLGPVDILVNCAGVSTVAPIDLPDDEYWGAWDRVLGVNLVGTVRMIRACLPGLERDRAGHIVNIASTEGLGATRAISPYTVSKHGVVGLTRSLAVELGPRGVTVNAVCPGPINTGMTAFIPDESKAEFARRRVPLRRYGEPDEVAHAVWGLCLPGASFTNGAVLTADGGLSAKFG